MNQKAQPINAQFGAWFKQQRKSQQQTQEDLAERLACSAVLVQKIESGERTPSAQLVSLIAGWLRIPADDLASFTRFARGQLDVAEAEARFGCISPKASRSSGSGYLPTSLTPLIGRAEAVKEVKDLLLGKQVRLLTLIGAPGIGKTRLALQVARDVKDEFRDGVYYVGLSTTSNPDLVINSVAQTLGVQQKATEPLLPTVTKALGDRQVLLVLDNFEQILDASPALLELLSTCPDLKILITSREALYVQGEQQYQVPVLDTPDPLHLPPLEIMKGIPAVALFIARAQEVKSGSMLNEQNAGAIAAICTRLDGLPLAIELAAARIRLLSPQEMQIRLVSRLDLLTGGPRNLPARQQTLRAAIDWSYNLLTDGEQRLFAYLGVFVGGCTLEAAAAVCTRVDAAEPYSEDALSRRRGQASPHAVQELVGSLLDKNLLKREQETEGESRFIMLELVREYSLERLSASGAEAEIRERHAEYYTSLTELRKQELRGPKQKLWMHRFGQDYDNIRGALRWLLNNGKPTTALRLAGASGSFWQVRGQQIEGRQWLEEALAAAGDAPPLVRARALDALGVLVQLNDDHSPAAAWLEESLALYRESGDLAGVGGVLASLAFVALRQGDMARAIVLGEEGLSIGLGPEHEHQTTKLLFSMAAAAWYQGDFGRAEEFATRGAALTRERGDRDALAALLTLLGLIHHYQGDYGPAEAFYRECISVAEQIGARLRIAHATMNMAMLALMQGDQLSAEPMIITSLRMFVAMDIRDGMVEGLEGIGWLAAITWEPDRAAHLLGAAKAFRAAIPLQLPAFMASIHEGIASLVRSQMGEQAFTRAWTEGQGMSMEQAVDCALGGVGMDHS
ncbi:MAG: tetratricopeptide repeat protein [Chloroflexota bacterium]